jgi:FkbM family methyltransferase
MFYSQDKQDEYLETHICRGFKNGFFMNIGAHDGVHFNNTLYFEKYNNWTGMNVEAMKKTYDKLVINRPNSVTTECICNTGCTEIISGLKHNDDSRHLEPLEKNEESEIVQVTTKRFETLLYENNISHIHYLSIDVEGAEWDVIQSIDFDKVFIDVIGFKNNDEDVRQKIIEYLEKYGYSAIEKKVDIFMIHQHSPFYVK